uniref:Saposin B-type domain-containing protein n=1 Tax=Rhabditophanes sp. KR3021 TaxID=114890 RepID=A0AC35TJY1_9BILA
MNFSNAYQNKITSTDFVVSLVMKEPRICEVCYDFSKEYLNWTTLGYEGCLETTLSYCTCLMNVVQNYAKIPHKPDLCVVIVPKLLEKIKSDIGNGGILENNIKKVAQDFCLLLLPFCKTSKSFKSSGLPANPDHQNSHRNFHEWIDIYA